MGFAKSSTHPCYGNERFPGIAHLVVRFRSSNHNGLLRRVGKGGRDLRSLARKCVPPSPRGTARPGWGTADQRPSSQPVFRDRLCPPYEAVTDATVTGACSTCS